MRFWRQGGRRVIRGGEGVVEMDTQKTKSICITLHQARVMTGYTAEEFANLCAIPVAQYEEYERDFGETPARAAFTLRRALGITLDCLSI